MDDKSQVRHNQVARRIEIAVIPKARGQRLLVAFAENRNRADSLDIRIKAANRSGKDQVAVTFG